MVPRLKYATREYSINDFENMIKLLEIVFKDWPGFDLSCSSLEHGKWKFVDSPTPTNHTVVISEFESKLIGVDMGMLKNTKIGDSVYLVNKGMESAVHPDFRRKGVHTNNLKLKFDIYENKGALFHYGLTSNPILMASHKKDADRRDPFPGILRYYVKIDDVSLHLKNEDNLSNNQFLTYKIGIPLLKQYNKIKNTLKHNMKKKTTNVEIRRIDHFDDTINDFWRKIKNNYDFIVEKKKDYLNWRYCDARAGKYKVWLAISKNEVLGYLVLKIDSLNKNYKKGYLVEILALNERLDVADMLVDFSSNYFKDNNINIAYAQVIKGHPYEGLLDKYGFLDSRRNPILNMKIIKRNDDLRKFLETTPERIHYSYGESDSV